MSSTVHVLWWRWIILTDVRFLLWVLNLCLIENKWRENKRMQDLNRSFVWARSCLALELLGVAEIPVGLACGFNDASCLRATWLEILIRPLVLLEMEVCSTFFPLLWSGDSGGGVSPLDLCCLFRLSGCGGGKLYSFFSTNNSTKPFPAPPPLKPTLWATQLWELVLIPTSDLHFQSWLSCAPFPPTPLPKTITKQKPLHPAPNSCAAPRLPLFHMEACQGTGSEGQQSSRAVVGRFHATVNLRHFALMLLKAAFPGRWRDVTWLWPRGHQASCLLILCILPSQILCSLAAQALTFLEIFYLFKILLNRKRLQISSAFALPYTSPAREVFYLLFSPCWGLVCLGFFHQRQQIFPFPSLFCWHQDLPWLISHLLRAFCPCVCNLLDPSRWDHAYL